MPRRATQATVQSTTCMGVCRRSWVCSIRRALHARGVPLCCSEACATNVTFAASRAAVCGCVRLVESQYRVRGRRRSIDSRRTCFAHQNRLLWVVMALWRREPQATRYRRLLPAEPGSAPIDSRDAKSSNVRHDGASDCTQDKRRTGARNSVPAVKERRHPFLLRSCMPAHTCMTSRCQS